MTFPCVNQPCPFSEPAQASNGITSPHHLGGQPQRVRAAQHLLGCLSDRPADLGDDQFGSRRLVLLCERGVGVEHAGPLVPGQGPPGAGAIAGGAQEGLCVLGR